jgi:NADH-quinone oxidoreductase subunit L
MHLLSHGFFKALLFLGSGSVIHGCNHEQDIREMGGLRRKMPVTFVVYAIGMMALSGVPLFFAGAWTKEAIVDAAHHWPVSMVPYYLVLAGVFLTSLYMTRQMIYVFFGAPREAAAHAHESPMVMTIPLVVLAVCTIFFSLFLTPAWPWLESYLSGETAAVHPGMLIQAGLIVSLALVAGGISAGTWFYRRAGREDPLESAAPGLYAALEQRLWFDELYEFTILKWSALAERFASWMDRFVWDGGVRAVGGAARWLAALTMKADQSGINNSVDQGCDAAQRLGRRVGGWQSGQIQTYLRAVGLGMLALLFLYAWLT